MYQTCIIVGNLGADAELRYTPNGTAVCDFRVATNERWNDRDGQLQEKTTWFRVTLWAKQAETLNQYLTKGSRVLVEGTIDASAYTAQDGTPRASLELRARNVRLLGSRGDGGGGGGYEDNAYGGRQVGGRGEDAGDDWMSEPRPSGNRQASSTRPAPASNRRASQPSRPGGTPPQQPEEPDDIPF